MFMLPTKGCQVEENSVEEFGRPSPKIPPLGPTMDTTEWARAQGVCPHNLTMPKDGIRGFFIATRR